MGNFGSAISVRHPEFLPVLMWCSLPQLDGFTQTRKGLALTMKHLQVCDCCPAQGKIWFRSYDRTCLKWFCGRKQSFYILFEILYLCFPLFFHLISEGISSATVLGNYPCIFERKQSCHSLKSLKSCTTGSISKGSESLPEASPEVGVKTGEKEQWISGGVRALRIHGAES